MKWIVGSLIAVLSALFILLAIITFIPSETEAEVDTTIDTTETNVDSDEARKEEFDRVHDENNPVATIVLTDETAGETFEMQFELYPEFAPESVNNFVTLANSEFYNGLTMHRLVTDFVIQGGDPDGTGTGGPGYGIKGEFPSNDIETGLTHQKGAIAWARSSDVDSAGSQFYIVLNDGNEFLDQDYAVFGYMISGDDALEYFNSLETNSITGVPTNSIVIEEVSVDTKGIEYPEPEHL